MLKFYILTYGTGHGEEAEKFIVDYCRRNDIPCLFERIREKETIPPGASKEAWWRERRYAFLDKYDVAPVITAHHLDDCVQTWVWSSCMAHPRSPSRRNYVVLFPFE